ncbi:MAG: hypothetical protein ACRC2T_18695 [Thermoguttaceae bacterium]
MEFINKQLFQIRELFFGMTPGNRITIGLLTAVFLASIFFLFRGWTKNDPTVIPLYGGRYFSQSDQKTISDALAAAQLEEYDWKRGQLLVPSNQKSKYMAAIAEAKAITDTGDAFSQTVGNLGVYSSQAIINEQVKDATQRELKKVLEDFSWIDKASVIIGKYKNKDLTLYENKVFPTASVTIRPFGTMPMTEEQASQVSALVAGALGIQDANLKDIKIVDTKTGGSWLGNDLKIKGGGKTYEEQQKYYQDDWERRIRGLFPEIEGLVVATTVKLDDSMGRKVFAVQHAKPTEVSLRTQTTDLERTESDRAGRPGIVGQGGVPSPNMGPNIISGGRTTEVTENSETQLALQGTESEGRTAGLTPKWITASIRVPYSHIVKTWQLANSMNGQPASEPTEAELAQTEADIKDKIKSQVENLIGDLRPTDLPNMANAVEVIAFHKAQPEPEQTTTWSETMLAWLGANWETLSLLGIITLGLGVLWGMTRSRQPEPIVIYEAGEVPLEEIPLTDEELAAEEEEEARRRTLEPFSKSMMSLQHEVADLVSENPDAAASVLRQWIGNVVVQE